MKPKYLTKVGDLVVNDAHPNKLFMTRSRSKLTRQLLLKLGGVGLVSIAALIEILINLRNGDAISGFNIFLMAVAVLGAIGPVLLQLVRRDLFTINTVTGEFKKNEKRLLEFGEIEYITIESTKGQKSDRYSLSISGKEDHQLVTDTLNRSEADELAAKLARYLRKEVIEK